MHVLTIHEPDTDLSGSNIMQGGISKCPSISVRARASR